VIFAISVFFVHFLYFLGAFFLHFYVFNYDDFWCAFCFDFLWFFFLPPIVKVDISDIGIISVIPDMVKAMISGITNTPQKTYRIAQ
jgi:hypothetical protein